MMVAGQGNAVNDMALGMADFGNCHPEQASFAQRRI
jgi:hypothetical protein